MKNKPAVIIVDYAEIERRVLAECSRSPDLLSLLKGGGDVHAKRAAEIFHCPLKSVTKRMRLIGKLANYHKMYGLEFRKLL